MMIVGDQKSDEKVVLHITSIPTIKSVDASFDENVATVTVETHQAIEATMGDARDASSMELRLDRVEQMRVSEKSGASRRNSFSFFSSCLFTSWLRQSDINQDPHCIPSPSFSSIHPRRWLMRKLSCLLSAHRPRADVGIDESGRLAWHLRMFGR
ncbi:hypothetical protein BLNAU_11173 [Blattamonas nauphoetae]|uniref:Uncharacterized protein n=1 Tax=Blattamonas nauphoetae TaxID=2049346 RepID=A0ABQ9XR79_9EUKA|nr:hypothetical protein BLNAU_11173 [Blattamonas nauphoetae]